MQVDKEQFDKVLGYIDVGKKEGARMVHGGGKAADKGYFIQVIKNIRSIWRIHGHIAWSLFAAHRVR